MFFRHRVPMGGTPGRPRPGNHHHTGCLSKTTPPARAAEHESQEPPTRNMIAPAGQGCLSHTQGQGVKYIILTQNSNRNDTE